MKGNDFVTDLRDADHIMVHYADKTKDIFTISPKESEVDQVKEYSEADLVKSFIHQIWSLKIVRFNQCYWKQIKFSWIAIWSDLPTLG